MKWNVLSPAAGLEPTQERGGWHALGRQGSRICFEALFVYNHPGLIHCFHGQ